MDIYNRSIFRTLSYRLIGAVITALIVFALTGKTVLSIGAGAICLTAKIVLYNLHERQWAFIESRKSKQ